MTAQGYWHKGQRPEVESRHPGVSLRRSPSLVLCIPSSPEAPLHGLTLESRLSETFPVVAWRVNPLYSVWPVNGELSTPLHSKGISAVRGVLGRGRGSCSVYDEMFSSRLCRDQKEKKGLREKK